MHTSLLVSPLYSTFSFPFKQGTAGTTLSAIHFVPGQFVDVIANS